MICLTHMDFFMNNLMSCPGLGALNEEIPDSITQNLNPAFEIREYQEEAFARFILMPSDEGFPMVSVTPLHLLFNMATGSGKTLIMAGLILYLYEKGHRNFLFFVNSTNIIRKTQDNFLNSAHLKIPICNKEIYINGKATQVLTEVENFEGCQRKRHQHLFYNDSSVSIPI